MAERKDHGANADPVRQRYLNLFGDRSLDQVFTVAKVGTPEDPILYPTITFDLGRHDHEPHLVEDFVSQMTEAIAFVIIGFYLDRAYFPHPVTAVLHRLPPGKGFEKVEIVIRRDGRTVYNFAITTGDIDDAAYELELYNQSTSVQTSLVKAPVELDLQLPEFIESKSPIGGGLADQVRSTRTKSNALSKAHESVIRLARVHLMTNKILPAVLCRKGLYHVGAPCAECGLDTWPVVKLGRGRKRMKLDTLCNRCEADAIRAKGRGYTAKSRAKERPL